MKRWFWRVFWLIVFVPLILFFVSQQIGWLLGGGPGW